jgi:hypothetical protein
MRALKQSWLKAGREPVIEDMLQDDELHLLLSRDGLTSADFRRHVAIGRAALRRRGFVAEPSVDVIDVKIESAAAIG